jgi:hypothetical protein
MRAALLMMVVAAHCAIPMWSAREPSLRKSIQKAAVLVGLFDCAYALFLRFGYWWVT